MEKTLEYETIDHYYERLSKFKKNLINHIALTSKKLTIIAHKEVLEFITSTGYYEDYQLVNKVPFGFG
jgi:methionyl-tRNA synthetase